MLAYILPVNDAKRIESHRKKKELKFYMRGSYSKIRFFETSANYAMRLKPLLHYSIVIRVEPQMNSWKKQKTNQPNEIKRPESRDIFKLDWTFDKLSESNFCESLFIAT